jgi:phage terminase large subunit GpA-like protein
MNKLASPIPEGYKSLTNVLADALDRASLGKGKERHAEGKPFEEQDIVKELKDFQSTIGAIYQIRKKAKESLRLSDRQAANEFLDIIVYAAAAYIYLLSKYTINAEGENTEGADAISM